MKRILVVDDNRDAANTTAALLQVSGYRVSVAYGGLQAIAMARASKPDLVLLDLNMPVLDGYEVARILRQEQSPSSELMLVALTGRNDPQDVQLSRAAWFDHHLNKPFDGDLGAVVGAFLGDRSGWSGRAASASPAPN